MTDKGFVPRAQFVLFELRNSTTAVVSSLPESPFTGTGLSRKLKIDKTLTWKIINFLELDDIFVASQYIPGESSYKTFLKKATASGVSHECIDQARLAYDNFLIFMKKYTTDRASLDLMLQGFSKGGFADTFHEQKKANFFSERFLNGICASVNFTAVIVTHDIGELTTLYSARGFTNLLKFRPNPTSLYRPPQVCEEHAMMKNIEGKFALFPQQSTEDTVVPYFKKYCTCNLTQPENEEELPIDRILPEDHEKQVNIVFAEKIQTPGLILSKHTSDSLNDDNIFQLALNFQSTFPSEFLLLDVFVHTDNNFSTPEVSVYNDLRMSGVRDPSIERSDDERLPHDESVIYAGKGAYSSHFREIPWYSKMIKDLFDKSGEDNTKYDLYRVKIKYPYIPSSVEIQWL